MEFLDDLPKRDSSHDTAQAAESAFQAAIDVGQLFVLQQTDRNDYGTDAQIEARDDQEMTNLRVHVQLKGTEAAPNADDSVSVGDISRTNLNYLLAQPDSIYVCLHVPSGRLLVRYAMDVFLEYERHGPSWREQETITVRVAQAFDEAFQRILHARVLSSGRSGRNRRLEWTVTPPEKIPALVRRSIPPVEVPTDPAEAERVLVELYHANQDTMISASFPRFAAVLGTVPGGLDVAYMAEINLGVNGQPFDELRVREGIEALREAMGRGQMHPVSLLYCQGNGWLALHEPANAKELFMAALARMEEPLFTDIAAQCCKNLGTALEMLGESVAATQYFERALQLNPDLAEAHYALALQLLEDGKDLQRALTHLDAVTHRDASVGTVQGVQAWRAETLFRLGDSAAAFRELNNVLASAKGFDWVWPSCARQVAAFGRATTDSTIKALAFWRAYLREHPDDLGAKGEHFLCLAALHADGKPTGTDFHVFKQTAETLIEQGLPDAAFLWDRVGHWAQDEGNWENAEQAFRKAYELEPDRYGYCLGTALNFLGRRAEALPILLEQAEKHLPDAKSWFQVAVARTGVGEHDGAIAAYKRAMELDAEYDLAWFNLGGVYWNLRDFSRARDTWGEAIARFPEHKEARKLQRDLPFLFDGTKIEMIEDIQPCSPSELEAQVAYLASTPVAGIAQLLETGQCRLSKGVVRSLAVLGSFKTEFGQLATLTPPSASGEQKFRVAEVLPALCQLPDGGDLLRRIERLLQTNETDTEYNVTVMRIGPDLIVKDGNARTIAFYERRKDTADPFVFRVFLVEMVTGNP